MGWLRACASKSNRLGGRDRLVADIESRFRELEYAVRQSISSVADASPVDHLCLQVPCLGLSLSLPGQNLMWCSTHSPTVSI